MLLDILSLNRIPLPPQTGDMLHSTRQHPEEGDHAMLQ